MPERVNGLQVRIGTDTGQIMCRVSQQGALFPQLTGLHVNRASRLQEQAPVGGVVISGQTKSFLSRLARLDEAAHDTRLLKGIDQPVELIEVTGFQFQEAHTQDSDLLDRDKELALLQNDISRAHAIIGPAGIGKTVLLDAFSRTQKNAGIVRIDARANLQQSALFPVVETLRRELDLHAQSSLEDLETKFRSIGGTLEDQDIMVVAGLLGLQAAQPVLLPPRTTAIAQNYAGHPRSGRVGVGPRTAALTFDDLHWFDEGTIAALQALMQADGTPPRIVVTSHPSEKIDTLLENAPVTPVHLAPLSDEAAQEALSAYPDLDDA